MKRCTKCGVTDRMATTMFYLVHEAKCGGPFEEPETHDSGREGGRHG